MSSEIILFEKSLSQRLSEYKEILGSRGDIRSNEIKNEWYYYILNVLEPTGWQAIWKMSRQKCEEFDIEFPVLVFVMVKNVIFQDLKAEVDIVAVQDDISLPENQEVPLLNLFPTKQQENTTLDINGTANCLDQLRFFYIHLWQPWDCDDEDQDWLSSHLESRLQLYYDMQSGVLQHETGHYIRSLLNEAREIEQKLKVMRIKNEGDEEETERTITVSMIQHQVRRDNIKRELEILENPLLRNLVSKEKYETKRQIRNNSNEVCFVWLGGTLDEFMDTLSKAKSVIHPEMYVKSCPQLQEALDKSLAGDTIVLCPGVHGMSNTGGLEEGGNIMGFLDQKATTIMGENTGNVLLYWSANATLKNLTIDAQTVQMAMSLRNGKLQLSNCRVMGSSSSATGILILKDGELEAQECHFLNFGIGLMLDSGSKVSLTNCYITLCKTGIKICEDASIMLQNCKIAKCSEYGVKVKVKNAEGIENNQQIGSTVMLESFGNIKLIDTSIEENKKGDIIIFQEREVIFDTEDEPECIFQIEEF